MPQAYIGLVWMPMVYMYNLAFKSTQNNETVAFLVWKHRANAKIIVSTLDCCLYVAFGSPSYSIADIEV